MHILIIPSEQFMTEGSPLGGIFQWHQAKALKKHGNQVCIMTSHLLGPSSMFKTIENSFEFKNDIPIYRYYKKTLIPPRYLPMEKRIDLLFQAFKIMMNHYIAEYGKPDIVHAHNILNAGFIAQKLKELYGIPFILTEHSSYYALKKVDKNLLEKIIEFSNNIDVFTVVSNKFADFLGNVFKKKRIYVLHNLVNQNFFESAIKKKTESFIFFNLASLDENKNQELLIKAFAKCFKNQNVYLNIAGKGKLQNYLYDLASALGIKKQINFLGALKEDEVLRYMNESNVFVLTSNYETFGVVLIEALACGIPLIATKSGGPEDVVNEQNGILIEVGNETQLENAMFYMYENANKYDKEKLRDDAKDRFGENTFIKNVMKYYELGMNNGK